jgi:hypothetical protein
MVLKRHRLDMKAMVLLVIVLILACSASIAAGKDGSRGSAPFFPIGVWFEGKPDWGGYPDDPAGAKAYYDRCFADLAAHGFNAATVPNCPEKLWETLLQSAREHHMKIVLEIPPLADLVSQPQPLSEAEVRTAVEQVVAKIGRYDSLLRYQIRDEPPPQMMPNWLLVRRILAEADPACPAFSCFNSPDSLARAVASGGLAEAVFDIYPHGVGAPPQSLGGFLRTLDAFRSAAGDTTMWAVLQSFAKPGAWRYPSPEELRAVTYLSLAAGAKGVFYFIYQVLPEHPERLEGLVEPDGKPTPMYAPATALARELGRLSPLLLSLRPAAGPSHIEGDARVGSFVDGEGHRVLIVASVRPDQAVSVRLTMRSASPWKDRLTGEVLVPKNGVLTIPLAPGAGRVLMRQ